MALGIKRFKVGPPSTRYRLDHQGVDIHFILFGIGYRRMQNFLKDSGPFPRHKLQNGNGVFHFSPFNGRDDHLDLSGRYPDIFGLGFCFHKFTLSYLAFPFTAVFLSPEWE